MIKDKLNNIEREISALEVETASLLSKLYLGDTDCILKIRENNKRVIGLNVEKTTITNSLSLRTIPLTEVVKRLNIPKLTTTIFNEWLTHKKYGRFIMFQGDKKRTWQPNESFDNLLGKGYSVNSMPSNKNGKIKVFYTENIIEAINGSILRSELEEFVRVKNVRADVA
jgi:hypothetical protein